ncbi:MAG: signal recognition particle protein [Azospirillum sp.]|nr:signal recognition particle protein [Azospirillum sp.]MCA3264853.1 signal recognition particle protein [Azospirillum sp.]MCZ8123453.1 signal recognition particle protein [Magnetospirillum sp.]
MFEQLGGKLGAVFDRLRGRGVITEADVDTALREVRLALLEADVALQVVKDFVAAVRLEAIGQQVVRSVTPGQMVVKIVHDKLIDTLGATASEINLRAVPPIPVLMLGLQGSGKTTTSAKLAKRLTEKDRKKVLLASLDTRRPAAQEQLAVLGQQIGVATLPIVAGQDPVAIARRAMETGRIEGYDVVVLDTAGRLSIDEELMAEAKAVRDAVQPVESLLVVDALTGQDALVTATRFNDGIGVTGVVMTRLDGDQRGGAALSMRAVTGKPIKFAGLGEKMDALEPFHPDRVAGRILGMGDIVGLVEKAQETVEAEQAEKLAAKIKKGEFDFDDMLSQLRQVKKMGGLGGVMGMLPGVAKIKAQMKDANVDENVLKKQEAIICSMTKRERRDAKVLDGKRKRRIAAGSGTSVEEVNRLVKQFMEMSRVMKQMGKLGQKGIMRTGIGNLFRR